MARSDNNASSEGFGRDHVGAVDRYEFINPLGIDPTDIDETTTMLEQSTIAAAQALTAWELDSEAPYPGDKAMDVIQLASAQWLVVDNHYRARFLIVEGPLVLRETGETHVKHRVEWWAPDPKKRHVLTVHDGLLAAENWCRDELGKHRADRVELSSRLDIRNARHQRQSPGVV